MGRVRKLICDGKIIKFLFFFEGFGFVDGGFMVDDNGVEDKIVFIVFDFVDKVGLGLGRVVVVDDIEIILKGYVDGYFVFGDGVYGWGYERGF